MFFPESFSKGGGPFFEPQITPVSHRDKVSDPLVGDFMGCNREARCIIVIKGSSLGLQCGTQIGIGKDTAKILVWIFTEERFQGTDDLCLLSGDRPCHIRVFMIMGNKIQLNFSVIQRLLFHVVSACAHSEEIGGRQCFLRIGKSHGPRGRFRIPAADEIFARHDGGTIGFFDRQQTSVACGNIICRDRE